MPATSKTIFLVFLVLGLSILPLPNILLPFRPPWVLLYILYSLFCVHKRLSLFFIFFLGLCLDVLLITPLGIHSFALVFTTWIAEGKIRQFNFYSFGQQMVYILLFCMIYRFIIVLLESFLSYHANPLLILNTAISATLIWPIIRYMGLNNLKYE